MCSRYINVDVCVWKRMNKRSTKREENHLGKWCYTAECWKRARNDTCCHEKKKKATVNTAHHRNNLLSRCENSQQTDKPTARQPDNPTTRQPDNTAIGQMKQCEWENRSNNILLLLSSLLNVSSHLLASRPLAPIFSHTKNPYILKLIIRAMNNKRWCVYCVPYTSLLDNEMWW